MKEGFRISFRKRFLSCTFYSTRNKFNIGKLLCFNLHFSYHDNGEFLLTATLLRFLYHVLSRVEFSFSKIVLKAIHFFLPDV